MCDIFLKLKRSYYLNPIYTRNVVVNAKHFSLIKNQALIEYSNESIKQSIRKIENIYKDPNYKLKNIVVDALKDNRKKQPTGPFILGATYCFLLLLYINNATGR